MANQVTVKFGDKLALDRLSLAIPSHSITAILGNNGAGKSTLFNVLEGFIRPNSGQVAVLGETPWVSTNTWKARIGVMLQEGSGWSGARANEILHYFARLYKDPINPAEISQQLGLTDCGKTPFRRLSGGQKQRLSLAVALIGKPELLFLDEPTAGMDPRMRRNTWEIIKNVKASGATVVFSTHYLEEAENLAEWVHIIDNGQLLASGTPKGLIGSEKNLEAAFMSLTGDING